MPKSTGTKPKTAPKTRRKKADKGSVVSPSGRLEATIDTNGTSSENSNAYMLFSRLRTIFPYIQWEGLKSLIGLCGSDFLRTVDNVLYGQIYQNIVVDKMMNKHSQNQPPPYQAPGDNSFLNGINEMISSGNGIQLPKLIPIKEMESKYGRRVDEDLVRNQTASSATGQKLDPPVQTQANTNLQDHWLYYPSPNLQQGVLTFPYSHNNPNSTMCKSTYQNGSISSHNPTAPRVDYKPGMSQQLYGTNQNQSNPDTYKTEHNLYYNNQNSISSTVPNQTSPQMQYKPGMSQQLYGTNQAQLNPNIYNTGQNSYLNQNGSSVTVKNQTNQVEYTPCTSQQLYGTNQNQSNPDIYCKSTTKPFYYDTTQQSQTMWQQAKKNDIWQQKIGGVYPNTLASTNGLEIESYGSDLSFNKWLNSSQQSFQNMFQDVNKQNTISQQSTGATNNVSNNAYEHSGGSNPIVQFPSSSQSYSNMLHTSFQNPSYTSIDQLEDKFLQDLKQKQLLDKQDNIKNKATKVNLEIENTHILSYLDLLQNQTKHSKDGTSPAVTNAGSPSNGNEVLGSVLPNSSSLHDDIQELQGLPKLIPILNNARAQERKEINSFGPHNGLLDNSSVVTPFNLAFPIESDKQINDGSWNSQHLSLSINEDLPYNSWDEDRLIIDLDVDTNSN